MYAFIRIMNNGDKRKNKINASLSWCYSVKKIYVILNVISVVSVNFSGAFVNICSLCIEFGCIVLRNRMCTKECRYAPAHIHVHKYKRNRDRENNSVTHTLAYERRIKKKQRKFN